MDNTSRYLEADDHENENTHQEQCESDIADYLNTCSYLINAIDTEMLVSGCPVHSFQRLFPPGMPHLLMLSNFVF